MGLTSRRATAALAGAAAVLTVLAPSVASASTPAPAAAPSGTWLVQVQPGELPAVVADLERQGATVRHALRSLDTAVVDAPAAVVRPFARDPRVEGVVADGSVQVQSDSYDARTDVNSLYNVASTVGARSVWTGGTTGRGVDVALLDSGVTSVPGLDAPGKVVHGPDLSFDSQDDQQRYQDGFGHGTHMAGIIAGHDAGANPASPSPTSFLGIAPDARIVSVKVADSQGNADVSQVIAGIDWVVQNRQANGLNIRVLNLSLGTPSRQSYLLDPLAHAAEQAWHHGLVVVVSAGNDGTGTGKLLNPAQDPYVIAVGADDSKGTLTPDDDQIPSFSTRGDGVRNPDLVAHGTSVQSLRVPGSEVDKAFGAQAGIGGRFLRGSGTSQAAAVVSGAAALLIQKYPTITPDLVKQALLSGARRLKSADPQAQGAGMVDVRRVVGSKISLTAAQSYPRSTGRGTLEAARGGLSLETSDGVQLSGEQDVFGKAFSAVDHAALAEAGAAWDGGTWNGSAWTGTGWSDEGWAGTTWGGTDFAGRMWAGRMWAGRMWAGRMWAGRMWASGGWQ